MKGFFMSNFKVDITGINTSNLKSLTHQENMQLFARLQKGDKEAKDLLVQGNLKLVLSIIKKFNNKHVNLDDLFQQGVIGLIKAIDNFDVSYNLKLSTYAVPLILGEIKKYLRDDTMIRISRGIKDNAYRVLKFKEEYLNNYGKEPSIEEIKNACDLSEYEISFALDSLNSPSSIFEPIYNDGGDTIYLCDQIADTKENGLDHDNLISLNKALKKLPQREKEILIKRYIIGKTQVELANSYNISQAQVSRIEKNAMAKMRKMIR